jgi:hypothetical protein
MRACLISILKLSVCGMSCCNESILEKNKVACPRSQMWWSQTGTIIHDFCVLSYLCFTSMIN